MGAAVASVLSIVIAIVGLIYFHYEDKKNDKKNE
jgi:Na+-driven multidrug efflux pump